MHIRRRGVRDEDRAAPGGRNAKSTPPQWEIFRWKEEFLFSSVQSLSCVQLCDTMNLARQASLSIANSWSLPKPMSIESVMPSNHLILIIPFSSCPQSFPASRSFPVSQLFASGGQSIGVSASNQSLRTGLL